jgi:hypothetical protein
MSRLFKISTVKKLRMCNQDCKRLLRQISTLSTDEMDTVGIHLLAKKGVEEMAF